MKTLLITLLLSIVVAKSETIKLKWSPDTNAAGYSLIYNSGFITTVENIGNRTNYTFNITPGSKYVIFIIPYDSKMNSGPMSNPLIVSTKKESDKSDLKKPILSLEK